MSPVHSRSAMTHSSFDIPGQVGLDLWAVVCVIASLVLLCYALFGKLFQTARGWVALSLIVTGVCGTAIVLAIPAFHSSSWGILWTFVVLSLLAGTFYLNLLPRLGKLKMSALLALRILALAMLVTMLFEPGCRYVNRPKPEKPLLILVDVSGSMSFPDVQNGPTRLQSVWQTLRPQLDRINDHFVPQFFTFATDCTELKKVEDLAKSSADGKSTDIVRAIQTAITKSTRIDAQLVLISDGIDNTSPDVLKAVRAVDRAVHTVAVGSDQTDPSTMANIAVDNVEGADDFIVNHETKIKATIKSTALPNRVIDVKLSEIDDNSQPIGETITSKLVLQPVAQGQTVELPYKPKTAGVHKLAVWVDPVAGERSTVDNRQEFQGLALDPRIKVLYIEGSARPEYRDLFRALARDMNIEVATWLRLQQDKFTTGGTVDLEPFRKFPTTLEEWKKFDVIIIGDINSSYLSRPQQEIIEQLCAGGAGLMMIGGENNYGPGGYQDSPLEKALPVFVGPASSPQEKSPFIPRLTSEGASHPAMEGLADWFGTEENPGIKDLPKLTGNVVVDHAKSGAQVLLTHYDRPGADGKPQIVLAAQRYGQGRSMAFTADTTWRWFLPLANTGQESPYKRFWGQTVRWLAGEDVRNRQHGAGVQGLLNKSLYQLGESVRVRAMVRDDKGDVTEYAQVGLVMKKVGTKDAKQIPLSAVTTRRGMYDVTIPSPENGDYMIDLVAQKDGKELGRQTLKFQVIPPADEMLKIAANPQLMEQISAATQPRGFHYRLDQFPTLIDELIRSDSTATTARAERIALYNWVRAAIELKTGHQLDWPEAVNLPMQGALVFFVLCAEWILRRRWQLV